MHEDRLSDEEGRLAALRRYEILDTSEEAPFQRIVELVQTILHVPAAAVTLIDGERQWYKAARGLVGRSIPREASFCNETIRQAQPLAVTDALADTRFAGKATLAGGLIVRSYLGVPLTTPDGYNIGTLCAIDTEPRPFDARDAGILQKLAEIVVEQLELRQIARLDALTGALSRRGLFAELEREFLRATRYDRSSALVLIDIDHFHAINDRYGHAAGDAVLVSIANSCLSQMRKSDAFGRTGGEEFALLLPETEPDDARQVAERIRQTVEATLVETGAGAVRATISLGVAPIPAVGEGAATWFSEADIALYEAKNFGRNRVILARPRRPATPAQALDRPAARPN